MITRNRCKIDDNKIFGPKACNNSNNIKDLERATVHFHRESNKYIKSFPRKSVNSKGKSKDGRILHMALGTELIPVIR